MKKIIFLLLIVASSVFAGSASIVYSTEINNVNGVPVANCAGFPYIAPSSYSTSFQTCQNAIPSLQGLLNYNNHTCILSYKYINIKSVPNSDSSTCYYYADLESTASATWQCIQPTGGCPSGQTFDEQTCTCKCSAPPSQYRLLFETLETPESCTLINALLSLEDGDTNTISSVYWDSCNAQCLGELQPCPCGQSIKNGQCMNVEPPAGSCPSGNITFQTHENLIEPNCARFWFCDGYVTAFFSSNVGCCLGNDGTSDSNSTNPDSNSTNPDSNSSDPFDPSDPGDSGEDGEEDGGETGGGDSNTSNPAPGGGDSNTSTPAPGGGDSNTTSDSNSSAPGEYEDSDADKEGKGVIDGALSNAGVTFDKIQSDFTRLMNAIENGVAPISVSSGSAPQFCAIVFGKQICINLCDSFGYFYTIFY